MDSKEIGESLSARILELEQMINKANSLLVPSESTETSASTSHDLQKLSQDIQFLINPKNTQSHIHDELDKVFAVKKVGHLCNLCERDLAIDPERANASLHSLQETSVLGCGHVYHSKCLRDTTDDLDNGSTDPSCIFCLSFSTE